jgi:hypothetical protein
MALSYERLDLIAAQDGGGCVCVCICYVVYVAPLLQLCCSSDSSAGWWRVHVCVCVSIRQHPSAYVSVLPEQQAGVCVCTLCVICLLITAGAGTCVCVHSNNSLLKLSNIQVRSVCSHTRYIGLPPPKKASNTKASTLRYVFCI